MFRRVSSAVRQIYALSMLAQRLSAHQGPSPFKVMRGIRSPFIKCRAGFDFRVPPRDMRRHFTCEPQHMLAVHAQPERDVTVREPVARDEPRAGQLVVSDL